MASIEPNKTTKLNELKINLVDTKATFQAMQQADKVESNQLYFIEENDVGSSVEYIVGTQTASTGSWTGVTKDSELTVGKVIAYKLPYAGSGNASLTLTFTNPTGNNTSGAIPVYLNNTQVTTHYVAKSVILMVYDGTNWRSTDYWNSNSRDAGYGKISITQSDAVTAIEPNTNQLEATTYNEKMTVTAGNKWIKLAGTNGASNADVLTIGHSVSGVTAGDYGDSTNQTPAYGTTFQVPHISVDAGGHITSISTHTVKIPVSDNTNTATAADNILDGSNSGTQITYAPYGTQQNKLSFDTSNTDPTGTDRLNLNGYLYATKLYSGGNEVLTAHQTLPTATTSQKGLVQIGSGITVNNGTISVTAANLGLSSAMLFKGSIGTGGTETWNNFPAASSENQGFTYKVITAHTTAPIAKIGDVIVSNGSEWIVIPSGDEPSGTVTSVKITAGTGIAVSSTDAITTSGERTISHGDTSNVSNLTGTARTYVKSLTFDGFGHVTGYTTGTETVVDTNDKVTQNAVITTSGEYPLIHAKSATSTLETDTTYKANGLVFNPNNQNLTLKSTTDKKGAIYIETPTYKFGLLMGSGGTNHGIYDAKKEAWVLKGDASNNWTLAGNADTATKLGTETKGSASKPIYLNEGVPTATAFDISTYGGTNQHWGVRRTVGTANTGFSGKNTSLVTEDNGLLMWNSTDNKSIWEFNINNNNIALRACYTPNDTSGTIGEDKFAARLVYKDNNVTTAVGSTSQPVYISAVGKATAITTIDVAHGGTGVTSIANIKAGKDGNGNTISSTYLKLSGGTMTGTIKRAGAGGNWQSGRDRALICMNSLDSYSTLASMKTDNGSWDIGAYSSQSYTDDLIFSYIKDTTYSGTNGTDAQIRFLEDSGVQANKFVVTSVSYGDANNRPSNPDLGQLYFQFID